MTHPFEPTDTPAPRLLPELDDGAGPAPRISAHATKALVASTLRAHEARRKASGFRLWQMAAGLVLFLGVSGVSAALLLRPSAAPPASPPRFVSSHVTVPEEPPPPETPASGPEEPVRERRASTTADLLARANHLRSQGHWKLAARTYGKAIAAGPRAPEAYAALVASGALYLDKLGDARRATALFRQALARQPRGPLTEEARWGLAQAYRKLRNKGAEATALRMFLANHPQSVFAPQAEARLRDL